MEFHLYKILKEAKVICSVRKQIRVQSGTDCSWEQGTFSVMNMSLGLNCGGYRYTYLSKFSELYKYFKWIPFIISKVCLKNLL